MHRFRFIPRCAKSDPGICSPLIHSIVANDSVSGQRRPRSDCADAQADLGLRCPHVPDKKIKRAKMAQYRSPEFQTTNPWDGVIFFYPRAVI